MTELCLKCIHQEVCNIRSTHKLFSKIIIVCEKFISIQNSNPEIVKDNKIAKKSESGMYYICPDCNRFIERFEHTHGNTEIRYCKWCGCKMNYEE